MTHMYVETCSAVGTSDELSIGLCFWCERPRFAAYCCMNVNKENVGSSHNWLDQTYRIADCTVLDRIHVASGLNCTCMEHNVWKA